MRRLTLYSILVYNPAMETKIAGSIRLSKEGWRLLRALAALYGVSMTAALEIMLRDQARSKGVK